MWKRQDKNTVKPLNLLDSGGDWNLFCFSRYSIFCFLLFSIYSQKALDRTEHQRRRCQRWFSSSLNQLEMRGFKRRQNRTCSLKKGLSCYSEQSQIITMKHFPSREDLVKYCKQLQRGYCIKSLPAWSIASNQSTKLDISGGSYLSAQFSAISRDIRRPQHTVSIPAIAPVFRRRVALDSYPNDCLRRIRWPTTRVANVSGLNCQKSFYWRLTWYRYCE